MSVARWDDDHCPSSQREDGGHCAHADTHDVCDWCGAQWGEGGAMLVPVDQLRGAVEANVGLREAVSALRSAVACGEPLTPVLQDLVNRALSHPGGQ
jgi:hypothetical protein